MGYSLKNHSSSSLFIIIEKNIFAKEFDICWLFRLHESLRTHKLNIEQAPPSGREIGTKKALY